jgi:hypothetical protein
MSFEGLSDEDRHGLLAQGRRMLDTLHKCLGHTGHQGPVFLGFGASAWATSRFGHNCIPPQGLFPYDVIQDIG